jgi:hypothetical protein
MQSLDGLGRTKITVMSFGKMMITSGLPFIFIITMAFLILSFYNFLLFHVLSELLAIVVGCLLWVVAWQSRRFVQNYFLVFIANGFFWVAIIDLMHMLTYKGMGVFPNTDANIPTQFWLAARYMQSFILITAPLLSLLWS